MGDSQNEIGGRADGPVVQAGQVHGDVHVHHHPARPYLVGAGVLALAAAVVAAVALWPEPTPPPAQPAPTQLTLTTSVGGHCYHEYVLDGAVQGYSPGAKLHLTAQNAGDHEVVVTGMRVDVLERAAPPTVGEFRQVGCPGSRVEVRGLAVDLDAESPRVAHLPPEPVPHKVGEPEPEPAPPDFPYQVGRGDPEQFEVNFTATRCDCRFQLAVQWVADGTTRETATSPLRIVPHG